MKFDNCVILSGGKSSRMGVDKKYLPFGGFSTLIEYQIKKYETKFKHVFVSTKESNFNFNAYILKDDFKCYSPICALFTVLSQFKDQKVFIVPVDMPFIAFNSIDILYNNSYGFDITIPIDKHNKHRLCGFFSGNLIQNIQKLYENDIHKVAMLCDMVNTNEIYFDDAKQFLNLNYIDDYEIAKRMIDGKK